MPFKAQGNFQKRLLTLAAFISGIVGGKSVQLPKIAENNIDDSKNDSREMKYRRWLNNKHINYKDFYLPFLEILLDSFKNQTLYIAIDGSVVGRGCMCLMVSLIYKNRALPLIWLVVKQKKGHLLEELHIELLQTSPPTCEFLDNLKAIYNIFTIQIYITYCFYVMASLSNCPIILHL